MLHQEYIVKQMYGMFVEVIMAARESKSAMRTDDYLVQRYVPLWQNFP